MVATRSAADYVDFGVFWAALYLVIAALSGVQQEITRGTGPVRVDTVRADAAPANRRQAFVFGAAASVLTSVVIIATAPLWMGAIFAGNGWMFVLPLAVGAASYVVVAVLSGTLYGLELWRAISLMIGVDGVLRLLAVLVVLMFTQDIGVLVWAVVVPFPLTPLVLWLFLRRSVVGRSELDVGYRALTWNVARTVVAAAALGLLISGYPLVLTAMSPEAPRAELGASLAAINLIRAPLVIVVLSLQSYFVIRFRKAPNHAWALFVRLAALILAVTVVAAAVAWFVGPPVLAWLGRDYSLDGVVVAGLVATSGVLAVLCVSGPLALARSEHGVFTAGWVVAAVATIVALLLPGDLAPRMLFSLAIGPTIGVIVHVVGLAVRERSSKARLLG